MAQKKGSFGNQRGAIRQQIELKVNAWGAIRDMVLHAMNKGQLPILAGFGLLALIVYRAPPEQMGPILDRILRNMTEWKGVSYLLNGLLIMGWTYHSRRQRRSISTEMDRIGREKTRLQESATNCKLTSSTNP